MFGTVDKSSRILIRDGRAQDGWAAARLHMHAEDEFSAGSYESAKRDAVRLLRGVFPIRIVVEGPDASTVEPLTAEVDRLVALGEVGHLPVGGHKTRGAGWGRWRAEAWIVDDVDRARSWTLPEGASASAKASVSRSEGSEGTASTKSRGNDGETTHVRVANGLMNAPSLTLGEAAVLARAGLGDHGLVAWWCDPTIDLTLAEPPAVFGRQWPNGENIRIDEVAFYANRAAWRSARTAAGPRWVLIEEVGPDEPDARPADVIHTPAHLHGSARFAAAQTSRDQVLLREWHVDGQILGFTLVRKER